MSLAKRSIGTTKSKQTSKKRGKNSLYQLKITLLHAPVPIWRRLIVRSDLPLDLLHEIIQIAMGWWNYHQHSFTVGGKSYGDADSSGGRFLDEAEFTVQDLLQVAEDELVYEYDFGDSWQHSVVLEEVMPFEEGILATCIMGKRACPPEDVGGPPGYADFLDTIEDPMHEEQVDRLEWVGGDFDADAFDQRTVNLRLILLQQAIQATGALG